MLLGYTMIRVRAIMAAQQSNRASSMLEQWTRLQLVDGVYASCVSL